MGKRIHPPRPAVPPHLDISKERIVAIIERARECGLSADDCEVLKHSVETLEWLETTLANNGRALSELRRFLGIAANEGRDDLHARAGKGRGDKGHDDKGRGDNAGNGAGSAGPGATAPRAEAGADAGAGGGGAAEPVTDGAGVAATDAKPDGAAPTGADAAGPGTPGDPAPDDSQRDGAPVGDDDDEPNPEVDDAPQPSGHGRRSADEYTGARCVCVEHRQLKPGDPCPVCSQKSDLSNKERRRGKLYALPPARLVRVTGQAPLTATIYERERLRCHLCGMTFTAPLPAGVDEKRKYDPQSAAMIARLKYGSGLPFNRIAGLEESLGIPLPASTQWDVVNEAASKLAPVYAELVRLGAQAPRIYNDDTMARILEVRREIDRALENGTAQTDRTGIFTTAVLCELADGPRIPLFITGRQHAGENLNDVLAKRDGALSPPIQMCDALSRNLPADFETVLANCLAHGRRQFVGLVEVFPEECLDVIDRLALVYRHDAVARERGLSDIERLAYHQTHSKPVMDDLKVWMAEQFAQRRVEPNSRLGKAITYFQNHWEPLTRFLTVAGAPLDNNICERALKKAILHRKNSLFFKTLHGARVGDLYLTLIHAAELNAANAFDYLTAMLANADDVARAPADWLPWNYGEAVAAIAELALSS